MFQAMTTKYFGPTNHRGARIRVKAQVGTAFFPWDYALNSTQNHTKAMRLFAQKQAWNADFHVGSLPCGTGYVGVYPSEMVRLNSLLGEVNGMRYDTMTRID